MKFRVERDAFADAVAWTARSLPSRPTVPVLAGLLLDASDEGAGSGLTVSAFDYEVSAQCDVAVTVADAGQALVSGRLLADITRALPAHPVDVVAEGSRVTISCGSSRFTLPTMPLEDYPRLPSMPTVAGTVDSSVFGQAVAQVAVAAGRDDTLPMLTGVRVEIDGERLTLAATDRYRLAVRELTWHPADPSAPAVEVLVPARTLAEVAKSFAGAGGADAQVTIALSSSGVGEGIIGFSGTGRRTTSRLLDAAFPPYRSLLPNEFAMTAEIDTPALVEAVKRAALVTDRGTPVRMDFSAGSVALSAGGEDEGRAEEQLEAEFSSPGGEELVSAFNPSFLLDGLTALDSATARLLFTSGSKPVVLRPAADDGGTGADGAASYTYLIQPVRLPG